LHSFLTVIFAAYPDLNLSVITEGMIGIPVLALVIWIPLALIAGVISKKKGKKPARWFVGVSLLILIVAGAAGGINLLSELFA